MTPETTKDTTQDKLACALAVCGEVAKLYRKHGSPANFHYAKDEDGNERITSRLNHAWKRNIRSWAKRHSPVKHVPLLRCEQCGLWFVGPTMVRCQCKVACKPRTEED